MLLDLSRWASRYKYVRLSSANPESDGALYSKMSGFISSKRARTALIVAAVLIVAFLVLHSAPRLPPLTPSHISVKALEHVNWSRFAYVQYVTDAAYLCNSVMIFESLQRLGSKADRLMMYPIQWDPDGDSSESRLLAKARDEYGANLMPIHVQRSSGQETTWIESFTKLLAFNQTQYARVISLDSDATVLQPMDELFLLPPAPVAMPRAYWLDPKDHVLSSQLIVIQPSNFEFKRVMQQIEHHNSNEFDMEIVNNLYGESCIILPHRPYDLLTGEFRKPDHHAYLGSTEEAWDPEKILEEAKFLHFSDWPYPKPWINASEAQMDSRKPPCYKDEVTGAEDCRDQQFWMGFYEDFSLRRNKVCGKPYGRRLVKKDMTPRPPSPWEPIF